jgi:tetratricopeptide (TPR) repeat protein
MEYINGTSLHELVNEQGKLHENIALHYIKQVANALLYIHQNNINHLDLKPTNILRNLQGNTTIIDFGLAKHYDYTGTQTSNTPTGFSTGYTPIEQLTQNLQQFNPTADIYALGATLFFLLTAQNPPDATTLVSNRLPQLPDYISNATKNAVKQAMQPDKNKRPQNVEEFLALLPNEQHTRIGDSSLNARNDEPHNSQDKDETKLIDCKQGQNEETKIIEDNAAHRAEPTPTPPTHPDQNKTKKQGTQWTTKTMIIGGVLTAGVVALGIGVGIIIADQKTKKQKEAEILREAASYKIRGDSVLNAGEYDQAIVYYQKAIDINPNNTDARAGMENAHGKQEKRKEAEAYKKKGDEFFESGGYEQAITSYQQAIATDPLYAKAHYAMGTIHDRFRRFDQSIACYQKAIEIDPNDAEAHYNMGDAYADLKKYAQAVPCYQKSIDINPSYANAHFYLGCAYDELKQYDKSIPCYQNYSNLDPKNAYVHTKMGLAYENLEQYNQAILCYQKAIDLDPKEPETYYHMGLVYAELKKYEQAIAYYQKAINVSPYDGPYFHSDMGLAYAALKMYNQAIICYQNALTLSIFLPETAYINYHMGIAYAQLEKYEQAISCWQRAAQYGREDAQKALRQMGRSW